ncbi:MAG: hypothetical protein KY464_11180, partial [Gemmatimonadetes bacterium]|nr:hypothetical protein [Gemmatimonadota bacterium]
MLSAPARPALPGIRAERFVTPPRGLESPARRTELSRTHDFGADPKVVLVGECIVGARAAPGTTHHRRTEARGEHPL